MKLTHTIAWAFVFAWLAQLAWSAGVEPPPTAPLSDRDRFMKEMPDPNRVFEDMKVPDERETIARQWGALYQLNAMPRDLSLYDRAPANPSIKYPNYIALMARLEPPKVDYNVEPGRTTYREWIENRGKYEIDKTFRKELLKRYFSPGAQAYFLGAVDEPSTAQNANPQSASPAAHEGLTKDQSDASFFLVFFGLCALPLIIILIGRKFPLSSAENSDCLQLPEPLV